MGMFHVGARLQWGRNFNLFSKAYVDVICSIKNYQELMKVQQKSGSDRDKWDGRDTIDSNAFSVLITEKWQNKTSIKVFQGIAIIWNL